MCLHIIKYGKEAYEKITQIIFRLEKTNVCMNNNDNNIC